MAAVEDLENDMLKKKKDAFPSIMSDACKLLNGFRNNYGGRSVHTEAKMEWHLLLCLKKRMSRRKVVRRKKSHVLDARRSGIMPVTAMKKCQPRRPKMGAICS